MKKKLTEPAFEETIKKIEQGNNDDSPLGAIPALKGGVLRASNIIGESSELKKSALRPGY